MGQARRVIEAPATDADASVGEFLGLVGVADADSDLLWRHAVEQALHDCAPGLPCGSRDDYHDGYQ